MRYVRMFYENYFGGFLIRQKTFLLQKHV